jgi:Fe-S-cluster containining protein
VNEGPTLDALPAGALAPWLAAMRAALRGERDADVPCGACTACCTSSQFVHIDPGETDTLAVIPPELLFAAPGLPKGHVLLGYDERGHCPMLVDGGCSIYGRRPRTCRTYDCRIFAATGVEPDQEQVARQAGRWRFDVVTPADHEAQSQLRAASAGDLGGRTPVERAVRIVAASELDQPAAGLGSS